MRYPEEPALAGAYAAATWLLRARTYYNIGFINAVLAETSARAMFEYAHPLHAPLLQTAHAALGAAGVPGPHIVWFQALSLAFSCGALVAVMRLLRAAGCGRAAAASGALLIGACESYWGFATQTTAYPAALCALYWSFEALLARRGLLAGAALGLSTGFTLATAAALPAEAFAAREAGVGRRFWLGAALGAAAAWAPMLLLRGAVPAASWAGFFAIPGRPVWLAEKLWDHGARWAAGAGVDAWDALVVAVLALLAWRRREPGGGQGLTRLALGAAGGIAAFFLVTDSLNRFKYAAVCTAALGLAPLLRRHAAWLAAAALAVGAHSLAARVWPDHSLEDPGIVEGRFVESRLAGGLLLCGGPPDWRLAYFHPGLRMTEVRLEDETPGPFVRTLRDPGPALEDELALRLRSGERVLLAADRMYQLGEEWDDARIARRQAALQSWLGRRFRLGSALVSPLGQWYYPVLLKGGARDAANGV